MNIIDIYEYREPGYKRLMSYNDWRVAILNYTCELKKENINYVEAHLKTDEVFILLEGECQLILYEKEKFHIVNMDKNKIYNIKKGVYHTHVLSEKAKLVIVEEENTNDSNSKRIYFNERLKEEFMKEVRKNGV